MDDEWWRSADASWWVKLNRASRHIEDLDKHVHDFMRRNPYAVVSESGPRPNETTYRLRVVHAIPIEFGAIVGDCLHNLRSALDCAAFELARRYVGRGLTEAEERACEFPIRDLPSRLDAFFRDRCRLHLYGPRERRAIAGVQPGWRHDHAMRLKVPDLGTRQDDVKWDELWLLNRLSNIDKHRRLHIAAWWPDLTYWTSDDSERVSARWTYGRPPFENGDVLGRLLVDEPDAAPPRNIYQELDLRIVDPPAACNQDLVGLLRRMHQYIASWVVPRVLNPYWLDANGNLVPRQKTSD